MVELQYFNCMK